MPNLRYINRGHTKDIVLLPGWATDSRIFDRLDIDFNYIVPEIFAPDTFERDILEYLKEKQQNKISILGWSMGAFAAAKFISKYPDLIENAILIGIKEKYEADPIEKIKEYLKKNKKIYLNKFYEGCFSVNEKDGYEWFRSELLGGYIERFDIEYLFDGLDYLLDNPIDFSALKNDKIKLVWGAEDKIVPAAEIIKIKEALPQKEVTIINYSGHLPFLNREFKAIL